jgi:hypothetical protein
MFRLSLLSRWLRGGTHRIHRSVEVRRFRPTLEVLECRLTPSSNITTSLMGGNLTITDNAAANITLSQPAANEVTITTAAGTTINGQTSPVTITGVTGNLNVNLGAGNDGLTFDLSNNSFAVGNLSITGTTGNKTVVTSTNGATNGNFLTVNGNYSETLGNGSEFTSLDQFDVSGNMNIQHANGNSLVFLSVDSGNLGSVFNTVGGNMSVVNMTGFGMVGSGFDVDALEETNVGGNITALMGTGDPTTGFAGWTTVGSLSTNASVTVGGNVNIIGTSGFLAFGDFANDGEEVANAHVTGDVMMNLGSGAGNTALFGNSAEPSSTSANNVVITGSGAHDAVTIAPSTVSGNLAVTLTGQGGNSITVDDLSVAKNTTLMAAGGGNSIAIDNQVPGSTFGGSVMILTGGTNNILEINSHSQGAPGTTTFEGPVFADLGGGDDELILAEAGKVDFEVPSTINGGTGTNFAFVNDANIEGVQPKLINFS